MVTIMIVNSIIRSSAHSSVAIKAVLAVAVILGRAVGAGTANAYTAGVDC